MFGIGKTRKTRKTLNKRPVPSRPSLLETLESRTLLSTAVNAVMHSDLEYALTSAAQTPSDITGYTPSEVLTAYGFNNISLDNGQVAANGQGQTIAIVDAFNDPDLTGDVSVFDNQFGLPAPDLKIVSQSGSSKLPANDPGWASEISLDVEWTHAIAPAANILLVEASSTDTTNLMDAVNYARNAPGVSVVSMSWGGSEFFSWGGGGESASQLTYDPDFTTPPGHQGVTFVAAAGDSGSQQGVQWPASSPNVLSVGGTSLNLADLAGDYGSETGWSGTSSGYSQIETEPTYQMAVQDTGARSVADVSYVADPNTGVAVYDSDPYEGYSGWQEVGGTSVGAPQWAALIAIADQGRTLAGEGTLDGATQTLPDLYSLYSAPGTDDYSTYTSYFNDVLSGGGTHYHFHFGGGFGGSANVATSGYDLVTGLGTPKAAALVDAFIGSSSSTSGGSTSSGGSTNGSTNPAVVPASPIDGIFKNTVPVTIIEGKTGSLKLKLTNVSAVLFSGPVTVTLYASLDGTLSSTVKTLSLPDLTLVKGRAKVVTLKFDYPILTPGSYYFVASIQATATDAAAATAVTSRTVSLVAPTVDLDANFASKKPIKVNPDHNQSVAVDIKNLGNVTASGTLDLVLYASADGSLDLSAIPLKTITGRLIKIRAGKTATIHVHFKAPTNMAGGTYDLIVSVSSVTNPADNNPANNVAEISTSPTT